MYCFTPRIPIPDPQYQYHHHRRSPPPETNSKRIDITHTWSLTSRSSRPKTSRFTTSHLRDFSRGALLLPSNARIVPSSYVRMVPSRGIALESSLRASCVLIRRELCTCRTQIGTNTSSCPAYRSEYGARRLDQQVSFRVALSSLLHALLSTTRANASALLAGSCLKHTGRGILVLRVRAVAESYEVRAEPTGESIAFSVSPR